MNCEKAMNTFFELDKNERLPLKLTLHLFACKKCRSLVRSLTLAEKSASKTLQQVKKTTDAPILSIMENIKNSVPVSQQPQVSLAKWITGGIIMICLMLFFNFLTQGNSSFSFIFAIVFAGVVCAYSAIFVGSNLDFFVKKIQKGQRMEFFS
ncbi:MAG: hypothetical protein E7062_01340 [Spirochaetaceae bacterium]|nr:hypothetical protein [Spirochaetaceae bacterium]